MDSDSPRPILLVYFALFSFLTLQGLADPLRLNLREGNVVIPSELNDYAMVQEGAMLFAAWTERREDKQRELVLVEVDLEQMTLEELWREAPTEGVPLAPQLVKAGDHLELVWLTRKGRGSRSRHFLNVASLQRDPFEVVQRKEFDYGVQMRSFQLLSCPRGVFVVGASTPEKRAPMELRAYRKGSATWEASDGPTGLGPYNQQPSLMSDRDYLHLAWVSDGRIALSRSPDGLEWSEPQPLSGAGAGSPLVFGDGDSEISVAWIGDEGKAGSRIQLATSRNQGVNWWHASQLLQISGSRCRLMAGITDRGSQVLLYSYWDSSEACEKVESCIMASGLRRERLDQFPDGVCGRSLRPSVTKRDNELYVVWQERRGSRTGIALNYAVNPLQEWLSVPRRVLDSNRERTYSAPRLVFWKERMFLICFIYQASRRLMERSLQLGDLLLFERGIEDGDAG